MSSNLSRRRFIAGLGAGAGAGALGVAAAGPAGAIGLERNTEEEEELLPLEEAKVPFDGEHQAGISTPPQADLWLIAFDVKDDVDRARLRGMMRLWTADARRMSQGIPPKTDLEPEMYTAPANLTFTVGFGAGFFDAIDRVDERPEWLGPLPEYQTDELRDEWNDGDLCLQICCDDPLMLSHAARWMIKNAAPFLDIKWVQTGFLNALGAREPEATPRNRFGQLDGTVNPRGEEDFDKVVWIESGPDWLRGGSAMVVRRIEMDIDGWDILDRPSREEVAGRTLDTGAPLGGTDEFEPVDLEATDEYGLPIIDRNSHVARSMPPKEYPNQRILRRVYNYDLPPEPDGRFTSNTGLIFICYQKNPLEQFHPIQERLAERDRLNEWIFHIGSAVFAMPRGTSDPEEYWAQDLLED
ncbi:MAG TPA: Dyp-type peroxidase [Actinomycetales bacterium]|uniref:Dyp-type peroxidase n=1 Tax=uncultured Corynebacterium sp. TaxID=159447 RepID=UPI0017517B9F|nr:Dyp-type peroxidase [uncultured Corynebacterium sp.]HHU44093.1 Dyp-type peroxidase [Actinomycetales bacterium]